MAKCLILGIYIRLNHRYENFFVLLSFSSVHGALMDVFIPLHSGDTSPRIHVQKYILWKIGDPVESDQVITFLADSASIPVIL